jgi:hypothetical protein
MGFESPRQRCLSASAKLTAAWQAAVARLIEAGYDPADVYATMIRVGLSGAEN